MRHQPKDRTTKSHGSNGQDFNTALEAMLRKGVQGTQAAIVKRLSFEGYAVTQSSVSRAIKRLGAVKSRSPNGSLLWYLPDPTVASKSSSDPDDLVIDIVSNGWLIVVRTQPGGASRVAYYLDHLKPGKILGTVAGDDTVFVAPPAGAQTIDLMRDIRRALRSMNSKT